MYDLDDSYFDVVYEGIRPNSHFELTIVQIGLTFQQIGLTLINIE